MLSTQAVRTGKLAIVVLIGQFVSSVEGQTLSLATKPPQAKVESLSQQRKERLALGTDGLNTLALIDPFGSREGSSYRQHSEHKSEPSDRQHDGLHTTADLRNCTHRAECRTEQDR